MKILIVHPHDLFSRSEPWTIRIKSIAKEFANRGHRVKLCYFPLEISRERLPENTDTIEIIPFDRTPSPRVFVLNTIRLIQLCGWADVVHFQKCHHYASIPTAIAAYIAKKPLHYDWDDWEEKIWYESCGKMLHSRFIGYSFKVLERWLPVFADSVSCSSAYLKELAQKFGVAPDRIFDSPVGADLDKFRPDLDGAHIRKRYGIKNGLVLYIGQLHGAQHVDLFIKAADIIVRREPGVAFMIVGEGFLEWKLKALAEELGIKERVIFTGAVSHDEIPYYVAAATVCVAPFRETEVARCKSPLKIVEYLASGKPIVAGCVGEVKKMVGGVGMLVEPGDYALLAENILALLENEGLRKSLGAHARRRAEKKYNWSFTADSILSAYNKICEV